MAVIIMAPKVRSVNNSSLSGNTSQRFKTFCEKYQKIAKISPQLTKIGPEMA